MTYDEFIQKKRNEVIVYRSDFFELVTRRIGEQNIHWDQFIFNLDVYYVKKLF